MTREVGEGKVSDISVGRATVSGFGILRRGKTGLAWPVEAPTTANPTGQLHSVAVRCMLPVGRESKKEIPYQVFPHALNSAGMDDCCKYLLSSVWKGVVSPCQALTVLGSFRPSGML